MVPLSVVSEAQLLPELWEISDSETREAASIFLERGAMLYGACNGAAGAGNVELRARRSGLRGVVRGESRQVYFRAELGFLEGTPLCPCLIQVLPWVQYLRYRSIQDIIRYSRAHIYTWRAVESATSWLFYRCLL